MTRTTEGEHNSATKYLAESSLDGLIRNVEWVRQEVAVYQGFNVYLENEDEEKPNGDLITEMDILFALTNGVYVVAEYKCNNNAKARDKAEHQLLYAEQGIKRKWDAKAVLMVYVHDRNPFVVEAMTIQNDRRHYTIIQE